MRRSVLFALLGLAAGSAAGEAPLLLQPPSSASGLQLESATGRATLVRSSGQRLRLPLRAAETLEALVEFDGGWAVGGVRVDDARRELVVIVDGAAGVERLPPVPEPVGELRVRPVPLADADGFAGLAWLEGDHPGAYEVRVSEWSGAAWSPPETVSPARRGGQAGLAGTVLEDGRRLLVWSASDGGPSDLFWSLGDRGRWTPAERLAAPDRVPDLSPALLRVPGGALLVWSRRGADGYRLQTARWSGGWSAARSLGEGPGWWPQFAELGEGRFLVHRWRSGWAAVELDAAGGELRRAEVVSERPEPPVLSSRGGGWSLRWQRRGRPAELRWEARR